MYGQDDNVSWTNNYNESNPVHPVPERKEGGAGPAGRQRKRLSRVACGQFQFLKGWMSHVSATERVFSHCFENPNTKDTVQILWLWDPCSHTLFPSPPNTYLLPHTSDSVCELSAESCPEICLPSEFSENLTRTERKSGSSRGKAQIDC